MRRAKTLASPGRPLVAGLMLLAACTWPAGRVACAADPLPALRTAPLADIRVPAPTGTQLPAPAGTQLPAPADTQLPAPAGAVADTPPPAPLPGPPPAGTVDGTGAPLLVNPPPKTPGSGAPGAFMTQREFILSVLVIGFGLSSLGVTYAIIRRGQYAPKDTLRLMMLQLIIVGTLFCITAGFSGKDIAPAMGLFGTIAGYLLGKAMDKDS